jgi:hypothetical protein
VSVVSDYPHDRLTRLADQMGKVLRKAKDVRGVILLDDADGGCVHPVGYPGGARGKGTLFIDTAVHLIAMGEALGMNVEIQVNGKKVA